jgi:small subunit ribosomal protein S4
MSRYRGPRVKKMRALAINLPGFTTKDIERRPFPPGQHGQTRRGKLSDYGMQLREKQKLRVNYGLGERQMKRLVKEAKRSNMATGAKLLELLERRLDNVVFRAGFAPTIPAARQLVSHCHFLVNGRKVNIPSFRVRVGDTIQVRPKSRKVPIINEHFHGSAPFRADWISVNTEGFVAEVADIPSFETVPFTIDPQLVVEYYSKQL